jgi:hypothetical protein
LGAAPGQNKEFRFDLASISTGAILNYDLHHK